MKSLFKCSGIFLLIFLGFFNSTVFASVQHPEITIILDDVGYNYHRGLETIHLPAPIVVSIMPQTPFGTKLADIAHTDHKSIIIHVPMQPIYHLPLGPGGLTLGMTKSQVEHTLLKDYDSVPYATGMNNHMGSLLTQNATYMNWVMEFDRAHHLFFLDSLTYAKSVAYKVAKEDDVPTKRRNFFLDNVRTTAAINQQFQEFLAFARKHGYAIAIAHPHPVTLAYLQKELPKLKGEGFDVIPLIAEIHYPYTTPHIITSPALAQ